MGNSSFFVRYRLVESDLVTKVFATVQPHTLPLSINGTIFGKLVNVIIYCLQLARPFYVSELGMTEAADAFNHREMIFQKVVIPSSQFMTSLISNRHFLNEDLFLSFMVLLDTLFSIGSFHRPTLEFVLASPIVMAFSSCLSFIEVNYHLWMTLETINHSLRDWKKHGSEVVQSGKRMIKALLSEGFEDTLEQTLKHDKSEYSGFRLVDECHAISQYLGVNVTRPQ